LGDVVQSLNSVIFAIDRKQQFRTIGYLANPSTSNLDPSLQYLNYELQYFNAQWEKEQALTEDTHDIRLYEEQTISSENLYEAEAYTTIDIPGEDYNHLEATLYLACPDHLDSNCPEWDVAVYLKICETEDTSTCTQEFGRWITAYSREGKWRTDLTPWLAWLTPGSQKQFHFYTGQQYVVTLDFHFSNVAEQSRAFETVPLFSGASFDADYNDNYEDIEVAMPSDAKRAEIVAWISGHGFGADTLNCAEFCDHQHYFTIGDAVFEKKHPEADDPMGCANAVERGVVPNQFGTWIFGRGGWCPGEDVPLWRADITEAIGTQERFTIGYHALVEGEAYNPVYLGNEDAYYPVILMTSYVVFYK